MRDLIQFAVLGAGAGAIYTLLTQGLVLVYRASGTVNFAHAAYAIAGGFVFIEFQKAGWAYVPALVVAMLAIGLLGALTYRLVMRPLRHAAPIVRVIATLGMLAIVDAALTLRYHDNVYASTVKLPSAVHDIGGIAIAEDRLWLLAIAIVVTVAIWAVARYTLFGLATSAVAENEAGAASLGWSPDRVATVSWGLGGVLAAAAGVLIIPYVPLTVSSMTYLLIPVLAIALVAGFSSYPGVLLAALLMGIVQSEMTRVGVQGLSASLPFLVIVAILVIRGRALPLRSHLLERMPALGAGIFRLRVVVPAAIVFVWLSFALPADWSTAIGTSAVAAMMLLSIVVVTGYAGQLSLAQYALGGVGALVAGQLVANSGWPFELALLAGVLSTIVVGLLFAVPALRARGINLAIVTFGMGYALQQMVFNNGEYTGGVSGLEVGPQTFLGFEIDGVLDPGKFAAFAIVCLVLCAWVVSNVRRHGAGRRLIAVRTNERAAASLGINILQAKLYAFGLSAAIAGIGGIALAFRSYNILYGVYYDPLNSITAVTNAVVGGVGSILGAVLGSTLAVGGFPGGLISNEVDSGAQWLVLLGGIFLIVILITHPDGMAGKNIEFARWIAAKTRVLTRRPPRSPKPFVLPEAAAIEGARPAVLKVRDVSVRFGGVVALDGVSLRVSAGEVVGLIGPNGAGKTTFIDAVTGFVRPAGGETLLDSARIDTWSASRRAQAGMTRSFQSLELFDDVTVLDNIRAASDPSGLAPYLRDLVWPVNKPLTQAAVAAIRELELEDDLLRLAEELPYGKRRLAAIARALATRPSILLLDEPAAGLSEAETADLGHLIRRLADEWGVGVLLVEHNISVVMNTCDRVAVLNFGRKIAEGPPAEVRANPEVVAAYLGEEAVEETSGLVARQEAAR